MKSKLSRPIKRKIGAMCVHLTEAKHITIQHILVMLTVNGIEIPYKLLFDTIYIIIENGIHLHGTRCEYSLE